LTKTIIFNLNPKDNAAFAALAGNFQDGRTPGKIQWGPAWWFLDNKDGIEEHLNVLSNQGLMSRFVGMVTDSRSFLSFSRHEYFRRILCNLLGADAERGLLPRDTDLLGGTVRNICYHNAKEYFRF
jgi:glucuronate isomerase